MDIDWAAGEQSLSQSVAGLDGALVRVRVNVDSSYVSAPLGREEVLAG
jgi:hypothetical protein